MASTYKAGVLQRAKQKKEREAAFRRYAYFLRAKLAVAKVNRQLARELAAATTQVAILEEQRDTFKKTQGLVLAKLQSFLIRTAQELRELQDDNRQAASVLGALLATGKVSLTAAAAAEEEEPITEAGTFSPQSGICPVGQEDPDLSTIIEAEEDGPTSDSDV